MGEDRGLAVSLHMKGMEADGFWPGEMRYERGVLSPDHGFLAVPCFVAVRLVDDGVERGIVDDLGCIHHLDAAFADEVFESVHVADATMEPGLLPLPIVCLHRRRVRAKEEVDVVTEIAEGGSPVDEAAIWPLLEVHSHVDGPVRLIDLGQIAVEQHVRIEKKTAVERELHHDGVQHEPALKAEQFEVVGIGAEVRVDSGKVLGLLPVVAEGHDFRKAAREWGPLVGDQQHARAGVAGPRLAQAVGEVPAVTAVRQDDGYGVVLCGGHRRRSDGAGTRDETERGLGDEGECLP